MGYSKILMECGPANYENLSKKMEKPNVKHEAPPAQLSLPLTQ